MSGSHTQLPQQQLEEKQADEWTTVDHEDVLQEQIARFKHELQEKEAHLKALNEKLKEENQKNAAALQEKEARLKALNEKLKEENQKKEGALQEINDHLQALHKKLKEEAEKVADKDEQIKKLTESNTTLYDKSLELSKAKDKAHNDLSEQKQTTENLSNQLLGMKTIHAAAEAEKTKLTRDIQELKNESTQHSSEITKLNLAKTSLEKQLDHQRAETSILEQTNAKQIATIQKLGEEKAKEKLDLTRVQQELDAKKDEHRLLQQEKLLDQKKFETTKTELENGNQVLREQIDGLVKLNQALNSKIDALVLNTLPEAEVAALKTEAAKKEFAASNPAAAKVLKTSPGNYAGKAAKGAEKEAVSSILSSQSVFNKSSEQKPVGGQGTAKVKSTKAGPKK